MNARLHPYADLTPDRVLDALESVGLRGDGRLLALNSYENRVYQVGIEDAPPVVAKFYRPGRWTDAQILEEHAFVAELAEREIRSSRRSRSTARTLHAFGGFRFAVYPRRGGRAPELDDRDTLEWMGRFIGRIHAVGALRAVPAPAGARHRDASATSRATGCSRTTSSRRICSTPGAASPSRRSTACAAASSAPATCARCACTATATPATCCGPTRASRPAFRRPRRRAHGPGGAGPVDAAVRRPRGDDAAARRRARRLRGFHEFDPRELHLVEALRTLRLIHYSAWLARRWDDPGVSRRVPLVQHPALLAGPHPRTARADRADGRAAARVDVTVEQAPSPRRWPTSAACAARRRPDAACDRCARRARDRG